MWAEQNILDHSCIFTTSVSPDNVWIFILSSNLCLGLPNQNPVCISSIHTTCPALLIHPALITWIMLGEEYKELSCSFNYIFRITTLTCVLPSVTPVIVFHFSFVPASPSVMLSAACFLISRLLLCYAQTACNPTDRNLKV